MGDINEALFAGDGLESCADRPHIEIAWDQWSRTRIFCKHGVFEGISDFMDLNQGIERAMLGFRASLAAGVHNACYADTPVPQEWIEQGSWEAGQTDGCELVSGHDGEHRVFVDDAAEDAYWAGRRVYYVNGKVSSYWVPKPIGNGGAVTPEKLAKVREIATRAATVRAWSGPDGPSSDAANAMNELGEDILAVIGTEEGS